MLTRGHVLSHSVVLIFAISALYQGFAHDNHTAMGFGLVSLTIGLFTIARYVGQQDALRGSVTTTKEN